MEGLEHPPAAAAVGRYCTVHKENANMRVPATHKISDEDGVQGGEFGLLCCDCFQGICGKC